MSAVKNRRKVTVKISFSSKRKTYIWIFFLYVTDFYVKSGDALNKILKCDFGRESATEVPGSDWISWDPKVKMYHGATFCLVG